MDTNCYGQYIDSEGSRDRSPKPRRKELKAKIAELEKELEFVRDPKFVEINANSDKRVRDLSDHITKIAYENTELKNKLELTGVFHDAAVQRSKDWKITADELEVELSRVKEQSGRRFQAMNGLQAQLDQAKKDMGARDIAYKQVSDELLEARGKVIALNTELELAYESHDRMTARNTELKKLAYIGDTDRTYKEAQKDTYGELYKTQRDLSAVQKEASKNAQERDEAVNKIKGLQEAHDTYEHLSRTKQGTIDMLDDRVSTLVQMVKDIESVHADRFAAELFRLRFGKDLED